MDQAAGLLVAPGPLDGADAEEHPIPMGEQRAETMPPTDTDTLDPVGALGATVTYLGHAAAEARRLFSNRSK